MHWWKDHISGMVIPPSGIPYKGYVTGMTIPFYPKIIHLLTSLTMAVKKIARVRRGPASSEVPVSTATRQPLQRFLGAAWSACQVHIFRLSGNKRDSEHSKVAKLLRLLAEVDIFNLHLSIKRSLSLWLREQLLMKHHWKRNLQASQ